MYDRRSNLIYGFHGLDEDIGRRIINGEEELRASKNHYDWLGHGVYFWENSVVRARKWATAQSERKDTSVKKPFAIGAVLDLGNCLDLLDQKGLDWVKDAYEYLIDDLNAEAKDLPINAPWSKNDIDFKKRELDCAVIRYAVKMAEELNEPFDSVRAAFWEGNELYPSAGFKEFNHIQIAIINPECIKGVFLPRDF